HNTMPFSVIIFHKIQFYLKVIMLKHKTKEISIYITNFLCCLLLSKIKLLSTNFCSLIFILTFYPLTLFD
ncbi:hypothetical protein D1N71_14985, partial [Clostridioides difficile]